MRCADVLQLPVIAPPGQARWGREKETGSTVLVVNHHPTAARAVVVACIDIGKMWVMTSLSRAACPCRLPYDRSRTMVLFGASQTSAGPKY